MYGNFGWNLSDRVYLEVFYCVCYDWEFLFISVLILELCFLCWFFFCNWYYFLSEVLMLLFWNLLWLWKIWLYFGIVIYCNLSGLFLSYVLFMVMILNGYFLIIVKSLLNVDIMFWVFIWYSWSWCDFLLSVLRCLFIRVEFLIIDDLFVELVLDRDKLWL